MQHGYAAFFQLARLHQQPFGTHLFYFEIGLAFVYRIGQIRRQIDVEGLGQNGQLFFVVNRLESRNDRNRDAHFPTTFYEGVVFVVVEEHLCNDVVCALLYFFLKV